MRKQQEKIIEKAKEHNFPDEYISLLSRKDLTLRELQIVYDYIRAQPEGISKELIVKEVNMCIYYLQERKDYISSTDYYMILKAMLPESYYGPDTLIGNKKKIRLFKMHQFLLRRAKKNGKNKINQRIFYDYRIMLYNGFPAWHVNTLLRPELEKDDDIFGCRWYRYTCFIDDYIHNGKDSIFYHLAMEHIDILVNFNVYEKDLNKTYDWNKHRFTFSSDEIKDVFMCYENLYEDDLCVELNGIYLGKKNLSKFPILSLIGTFCKENELKPHDKNLDIFTSWHTFQLENPNMLEKIKECSSLLGQDFTTHTPSHYISISIKCNGFIVVQYNEYKTICVSNNYSDGWKVYGKPNQTYLLIAPDGNLFKTLPNGKRIPLSMKDFIYLYMKQNIIGNLMSTLLDFHKEQNIFYKDVMEDCLKTKCIMPLSFNEVGEYHNRAELIHGKYKKSADMKIQWNKQNINLSYLIIKAYDKVEPGISRRILINQKDLAAVTDGDYHGKGNRKPYEYLKQVLYKNILKSEINNSNSERVESIKEKYKKELQEELHTEVLSDEYEKWIEEKVKDELGTENLMMTTSDYISMCRQSKIKVRLDIRSVKQLENLHGRIATNPRDYRKRTGEVKVPEKSNFLELRKILPPEFEWIKTRKRLILETELQHHCVWSYAEKITKDKCAIYSFTDTRAEHTKDGVPKRYTIEFGVNKGGYYVVQVQGKYDRVNSEGMREYIQSLLDEYTAEQQTKAKSA